MTRWGFTVAFGSPPALINSVPGSLIISRRDESRLYVFLSLILHPSSLGAGRDKSRLYGFFILYFSSFSPLGAGRDKSRLYGFLSFILSSSRSLIR
jgi:hypothetical protein